MARRQKVQLVNGETYHIVIRAIDGINLFRDKKDFLRMIHDLFVFNDVNPVSSDFRVNCHRNNLNVTTSDVVTLIQQNNKKRNKRKRGLLVEILTFCLMPNHVHLLVRQLKDGGTSKFMKKFGGYALYFNKRYKRKGHLFQDRYQIVHIKNDKQLITVFVYIHTNPIAIIYPKWKEKGIRDRKKAMKFLEDYKWSSYLDYLGRKNFPSLTSREFLTDLMGGVKSCREFVEDWLHAKRKLYDLEKIAIE